MAEENKDGKVLDVEVGNPLPETIQSRARRTIFAQTSAEKIKRQVYDNTIKPAIQEMVVNAAQSVMDTVMETVKSFIYDNYKPGKVSIQMRTSNGSIDYGRVSTERAGGVVGSGQNPPRTTFRDIPFKEIGGAKAVLNEMYQIARTHGDFVSVYDFWRIIGRENEADRIEAKWGWTANEIKDTMDNNIRYRRAGYTIEFPNPFFLK